MTQGNLNSASLVWYCARTKPKQEHIAAANVRKTLNLDVFLPRLRLKRNTRRGLISVTEPLFPCYLFIRAAVNATFDDIRYAPGISSLVHFGLITPTIPDLVMSELKSSFEAEEPLVLVDEFFPGSEVRVINGAFAHLSGVVLRSMPVKRRVQVLFEILGRSTIVELNQEALSLEKPSIAALLPSLAA